MVVRNLSAAALLAQSAQALEQAIRSAQLVVLPGGFSGGDEPDGSGQVHLPPSCAIPPRCPRRSTDLLKNRDGLMLGICNGFQALVKLGLVPYGEIRDMDDAVPHPDLTTLIGRHQSRLRDHPGGQRQLPLDAQESRWATCTPSPSPTGRAAS